MIEIKLSTEEYCDFLITLQYVNSNIIGDIYNWKPESRKMYNFLKRLNELETKQITQDDAIIVMRYLLKCLCSVSELTAEELYPINCFISQLFEQLHFRVAQD